MKKESSIGQRLKELRGKLSQDEFSKKIGVNLRTYQRYESEGGKIPPRLLSKIAKQCGTTSDWILTGVFSLEKAFILEKAKTAIYLQELVEKLEEGLERQVRLKFFADKLEGSKEEKEELERLDKSLDLNDSKKFIGLLREYIQEGMKDAEEVKRFDQISDRSPLYSIFRRIEAIYNSDVQKGEMSKISALLALLDAFESKEGQK